MATHKITVNFRNCDHWHWSLNGGTDSMVMSGNTAEIDARNGGELTVKGVDKDHNVLATDTTTLEALPLPATYTPSCNPTSSQLSGFIYDDDHFVLTLIGANSQCNSMNAYGYHSVTRIFCYGSDTEAVAFPNQTRLYNGNGDLHGYAGLPWKLNMDVYPLIPEMTGYSAMYVNGGDCIHTVDSLAEIVGNNYVGAQWNGWANSDNCGTGYRTGHAKTEKSRPVHMSQTNHNYHSIATFSAGTNNSWHFAGGATILRNAQLALPRSSKTYTMPSWCTSSTAGNAGVPLSALKFDEAIGSRSWTVPGAANAVSLDVWPRDDVTTSNPYSGTYNKSTGWWFTSLGLSNVKAHTVNRGLTTKHLNWFNKYAVVPYFWGYKTAITIHPIKKL